jgi:uncharacterized membrane protein
MTTIGVVHTVFAGVALALGGLVVAGRKGTRVHRTFGHLYASSMLGVNVTAFFLCGLFGRMGPFHILAMVSLATVAAGIVPAVARRPRHTWFRYHATFMAWSYVGLLAAAAAEFMARMPGVPFVWGVAGAAAGVTLVGAVVIHGRHGARIDMALQKAGLATGRDRTVVATVLFVSVLTAPPAASAQSLDPVMLRDSAIALLDRGVILHDRERIDRARTLLERLRAQAPDDGSVSAWLGYALYRTAEVANGASNGIAAEQLMDSATTVLRRSAESHPLPETFAILGTITGQRMRGSAWRAILTSSRWERELNSAERMAPQNPRILMLRGINVFHAPARYGGMAGAKRYLEAAVAAFENDEPAGGLPSWGQAEALAWLGRVHARLGDRERARAAYAAALVLEPEYAWVRDVLLPGLDSR